MASSPSDDSFDPEVDLLQRYEQMIQTQVDTLNGIDDKAAQVARLIGVLIGLLLSAVSIILGTDITVNGNRIILFIMFTLAAGAYVVSMLYAIITYLSSKFEYGPSSGLGSFMAQYGVDEQDYRDALLAGYSSAIKNNRRVVIANSKRFEKCLASLIGGVMFTVGGVGVVIVGAVKYAQIGVAGVSIVIGVGLMVYILREEYLTLEREGVNT